MQIIAVTGTNGGGKGSFLNFLQLLGYKHYSARELILNEAKKRRLGDGKNVTNNVGNSLRKKKLGPFKFAPRWADRRHLAAFSLDSDAARETIYTQVSDLALITPDLIWKQ